MKMSTKKQSIIDAHVHPNHSHTIHDVARAMDKNDIVHSIILGRDTDPKDFERPDIRAMIRERFLNSQYAQTMEPVRRSYLLMEMEQRMMRRYNSARGKGTTNEELADCIRIYPGKFTGFGSVNLCKDEEYVRNKLKDFDRLPLKGFKFHPQSQFFNPADSENFRIIAEYCEKTKKIIMVHTGCMPGIWEVPELSEEANPKYLEPVARDFDIQIIVAHFGYYSQMMPGIWFEEALKLGEKYENVWGEISPNPNILTDEMLVKWIRKTMGMERVLFGSDYLQYLEPSIEMVRKSQFLSESEKEAVFYSNAERLLEWAGVKVRAKD